MIKHLSIRNFALIDTLEIDFNEGLSVITGETGAGKSILLGALKLILGERADYSSLKNETEKCVIEGTFQIQKYQLEAFFEENQLDYWAETILRREISPQGKSRNFINDTPTTLDLMKQLGSQLIDIHSQHQSLQINDAEFQLQLIDSLANTRELLMDYQNSFTEFKAKKLIYEQLKNGAEEAKKEEDYLRFQYEELSVLNLKSGETNELEEEQTLLANSEVIMQHFSQIISILSADENNVLDSLQQLKGSFNQNAEFLKDFDNLKDRFTSCHIELSDITKEIENYSEGFEFDPNRLELVEERIGEIYRLQQKHKLEHGDELLSLEKQLDDRLQNLANYDVQLESAEKVLKFEKEQLYSLANQLTDKRKKVIENLAERVIFTLQQLGIPSAIFKVEHEKLEIPNNLGMDRFSFLFSANKGRLPELIAKTASGGEISRLVLAIKALLAEKKQLPCIIFDEIDTGISGEVADQMGNVLSELAANMQVISITHLPQIAAKGATHYFVFKEDAADKSNTKIRELIEEDRVVEIAKMLSGSSLTDAAINNAKELLNQ